MTQLSVNINKVATLRNARGGNLPNVVKVALDCERFGAQGITVHPRPDERHIRYSDVRSLAPLLSTEFNIEGNPTEAFTELVLEVRPQQVTLVPDAPDVLTSNAGWRVTEHADFLQERIALFHRGGVRVSLFVSPDLDQIRAAREVGADRVELYTEPYARAYERGSAEEVIAGFAVAAREADRLGLGVNAGHDLNCINLPFFVHFVVPLAEVSIGHALIADALYWGLETTIRRYRQALGHEF